MILLSETKGPTACVVYGHLLPFVLETESYPRRNVLLLAAFPQPLHMPIANHTQMRHFPSFYRKGMPEIQIVEIEMVKKKEI